MLGSPIQTDYKNLQYKAKMKNLSLLQPPLLFIFCLLSLLGCQREETPLPPFEGARAFAEVEALVQISPRDSGTPGGKKAAEHLAQRLENLGVRTEIHTFKDQTPVGEKTFHNVIGRIPGRTNRWIVLGSHFDTMPGIDNFQGANDSGSSTGILLELARILSTQTLEVGIIVALFDGEEGIAHYIPGDGLHGSCYMVENLIQSGEIKTINAMVLLDMVGDKDLHFVIPFNSEQNLVKELFRAAHTTGHRKRFSLSHGLLITDDHVPFLEAGIPAIDIIDFRFGSAPDLNDYWHTAADDMDHISVESLQITGEVTLQLIKQLTMPPSTD